KGTCTNRLGISRIALEATILEALKQHLMAPELFKEFCTEFIKEVNRLRHEESSQRAACEAELGRTTRRIRQIVDAIADGAPARSLTQELLVLEAAEDRLRAKLLATPEQKVFLAPNMAELYRQRVAALQQALASGGEEDALTAVRALIDQIVLQPTDGV